MRKKLNLTAKIFICLILGAITGIILYQLPSGYIKDDFIINGVFKVIGKGFVRAMQMLVVPLVFCSLVCGSMSIGDTKKLGKVGARTIAFYIATTAIAITLSIGIGKLLNPGLGLDLSTMEIAETTIAESTAVSDVILNIIPTNPINSLAEGNMLQIIVFALLIGLILAQLKDKAETVGKFFTQFNDIMMKMTTIVMKAAPIGVFCLIATTFSTMGWNAFAPLLKYIFAVFLALAIHCLVTYMLMLKGLFSICNSYFQRQYPCQ